MSEPQPIEKIAQNASPAKPVKLNNVNPEDGSAPAKEAFSSNGAEINEVPDAQDELSLELPSPFAVENTTVNGTTTKDKPTKGKISKNRSAKDKPAKDNPTNDSATSKRARKRRSQPRQGPDADFTKPATIVDGKLKKPWRGAQQPLIDIDTDWSALTWSQKVNKEEMLWLLRCAGEDISDYLGLNNQHLGEEMVAVRQKREAAGTTGNFLSKEGQDDIKAAATKDNKPNHNVDRKKRQAQRKDAKRPKQEEVDSWIFENPPKIQLPSLSGSVARSYLLAIKRQALSDAQYNHFAQYEYIPMSPLSSEADVYIPLARTTYLREDNGDIIFSYEVQNLVPDILRHRDVVRGGKSSLGFLMSDEDPEAVTASHMHQELCALLVEHLENQLDGDGVDGKAEATKLVFETFAISR